MQEVVDAVLTNDKAKVLEELSDVYEVVLCLWSDWDLFCMYQPDITSAINTYKLSQEDIVNAAENKRKTHGSFTQAILLNYRTVEN